MKNENQDKQNNSLQDQETVPETSMTQSQSEGQPDLTIEELPDLQEVSVADTAKVSGSTSAAEESRTVEPRDEEGTSTAVREKVLSEAKELKTVDNKPRDKRQKAKEKPKKKKNFFVRFILFILKLLLILILLLAGYLAFSIFHRKAPLSMLPSSYSLYLHTDSAWEAVEPLLDLQAADILLSSPEFVSLRPMFMDLRASPLRENALFQKLAARRIDAALYQNGDKQDFTAVIDLGPLSAVSRLAPFVLPKLNIKGLEKLSYIQTGSTGYFVWQEGKTSYYIKPYRNLAVITSTLELLKASLTANNDLLYTPSQMELMTKKDGQPIRLIADAKKMLSNLVRSRKSNFQRI